jgi:hypothetical protein
MDLTCSRLCSQELARCHCSEANRSNPKHYNPFLYREGNHQQKGKKGITEAAKIFVHQIQYPNFATPQQLFANFSKNET